MSWCMRTRSSNAAASPSFARATSSVSSSGRPTTCAFYTAWRLSVPDGPRRPARSASERGDRPAIGGATPGLALQVPERAGLAVEVGEELHAPVALHERRHVLDVGGVVDPPETPLGDRVRLSRMRLVQALVRVPSGLEALVVEIVRDDVGVGVA